MTGSGSGHSRTSVIAAVGNAGRRGTTFKGGMAMGDVSEMILAGVLCEQCGGAIGDGQAPGHPRKCSDCGPAPGPLVRKVKCDQCGRRVRATGLQDHKRDAHG